MSDLSRVEQLLRNALGEDIYEVTPQSRVEVLLAQLNELIEGMGGGSVSPEDIASIVTGWLAENIHDGAVVDSSLSVSGAPPDSKKVGDELSDLKEGLTEIRSLKKNMFDPVYLVDIAGWTEASGVYSGIISALHSNFTANNKRYPVLASFEADTQYTISAYVKNNGESTTGSGVCFTFYYSDGTKTDKYALNSATDWFKYTNTSTRGKTVVSIGITYGSDGSNNWSLKEIQLEKGKTPTEYEAFGYTADDSFARSEIIELQKINPYIFPYSRSLNFASHAIESTYQVEWFDYVIAVGETVLIKIVCPDNDANTSYLNFNTANDTRLNPSALFTGTTTRIVSFTNTYSEAVGRIGLALTKVNEQNTYTVSVYEQENLPLKVDTLEEEVDAVIDAIGGLNAIPTYYEDHLDTAISTAQANMLATGVNGETFVFISDIHWVDNQKHSPALISKATKKLNIENTVFCGDTVNGGTQEQTIADFNDIREKFVSASKRFLTVFGNHDSNALDGGVRFTNKEFYTLLQKQNDYYVTFKYPYSFYMDNPTTKTRMIFLDTGMTNPNDPSEELAFLQSAVADTPNGWHILVFAHVIYIPSGGDNTDTSTYVLTSFMTDVCTYLDSVNTAGQKSVEAIFGGHCHKDYASASTGGIPIILIDTDSKQTPSSYTIGTITEQCFDIITVDYSAKTVKCTRVGRGQNRLITY